MSKKERKIREFEMGLTIFFGLRSNLSNDDIISALRPGLIKRLWKMTFLGLK